MIDALEQALVSAYKRNYDKAQNVEVEFDKRKGDIKVYSVKEVVNNVFDSRLEVSLEDALEINKAYEVGDTIRFEVTPRDFGRIAAQTAKQVIMQRVREEERQMIYDQYSKYENEIVSGEVERHDSRYIYVNLGNVEAVLSKKTKYRVKFTNHMIGSKFTSTKLLIHRLIIMSRKLKIKMVRSGVRIEDHKFTLAVLTQIY